MSLDQTKYIRTVYSGLDYASDLGGLYGALSPIFVALITVLNFWGSYQHVMDHVFASHQDQNEKVDA